MYLVCYPQGGWNDMMSRIWYCHQYCLVHNRTLVIDTTKNWFNDDIFQYLSLSLDTLYQGDNIINFITSLYEKETVYPPQLKGMNNSQFPKIVWKAPGHMETDTGIFVSTRLDKPYIETVLVFADCGSAIHINPILCHTTFSPWVLSEVKKRYDQLPKPYISVHIRNTDYKSDVNQFLSTHHNAFTYNTIFLASDHAPTIERCKKEYHAITFSSIPTVQEGNNIHESEQGQTFRTSLEQTRAFNLDIICDFLVLSLGTVYYFSSQQSGFSRSVAFLQQHKGLVEFLTKL